MTLSRPSLANVCGSTMSAVPSQLLATNSTDFVPGATGGPSWAEAAAGSASSATATASTSLIDRSYFGPSARRAGSARQRELRATLRLERAGTVARLGDQRRVELARLAQLLRALRREPELDRPPPGGGAGRRPARDDRRHLELAGVLARELDPRRD